MYDDNEQDQVKTGWVYENGCWYYYYSNGEMAIGWMQDGSDQYYFNDPGGIMGWSKAVDGYYLGYDGKMVTSEGWQEDDNGNQYYVGADEKVVTGWKEIDGEWYYFNYPGGTMGWSKAVDGYYLAYDGKMVTSEGWEEDDEGNWYYVGNDQKVVTGWKEIDGKWYYFDEDAKMQTGWIQDNGCWYYLDGNGSMSHDTTIDGYLLNNSGKMVTGTGWQSVNGNWYYLNDDKAKTGWLEDGDNWYYLYGDNGSMAWGTTIDGYYLDVTGRWIPDWISENLSATQKAAKILFDNPVSVSLTQSDETKSAFAGVNFEKDENGVYHTSQPDCWQYPGGYCDLYDDVFNAASSMDKLKYPFKVGNTEYVIWMWKGDYLNLGAGGEVGIYDNKHSIPSINIGEISTPAIDNIPGLYEVSKENALNMTLHASIDGRTTIFDWDPGEPNWWITGWNPKFQNIAQENVVLSGTIDFSGHDDLWEAFSSEHKEDEHLTFYPDTHIVDFKWQ